MDVGKPRRVYTVEPVKQPVPREAPRPERREQPPKPERREVPVK